MSVSKGNELLQELYKRLTGLWYKQGIYAGKKFNNEEVKTLLREILKEFTNE